MPIDTAKFKEQARASLRPGQMYTANGSWRDLGRLIDGVPQEQREAEFQALQEVIAEHNASVLKGAQ